MTAEINEQGVCAYNSPSLVIPGFLAIPAVIIIV